MDKKRSTRVTADRFIDTTLDLIAQNGGSQGVNLRQVSRQIGCAHTNVYNYFASYEAVLWAAFRRALKTYGEYLVHDLDDSLPPDTYVRRLIANLASYPTQNHGLYRFIASDPIDLTTIPEDILDSVAAMKAWLHEVMEVVHAGRLTPADSERIATIVLAYIDGETLNLINGRIVPGEDLAGRVVNNALRIIDDLGGPVLGTHQAPSAPSTWTYPVLDLAEVEGAS